MALFLSSVAFAMLIPSVEQGQQAREKCDHEVTNPKAAWNLPVEKILLPEEMGRILAVAKERSARDYVFFATCTNTGLRLSEVAHLKSEDVLRNCQLRVTRRKKRILQATVIDVLPAVHSMLTEWATSFDGWLFPGNCKPCVIHRTKKGEAVGAEQVCGGGHISLRAIQRDFGLILAEAGLRMYGRGIHATRHYAITEFYNRHRDLRACQLYAGHSNSAITERYASVRDMKEKINAMEAVL